MIFVVNFYKEKKNREIALQHVPFRKSVQEIIRNYCYISQSYKEILKII